MDPGKLMGLLQGDTTSWCHCVQRVGVPYGWLNCILTVRNRSGCSSLLSIGLQIPRDRKERIWKIVSNTLLLGTDRRVIAIDGPLYVELERR